MVVLRRTQKLQALLPLDPDSSAQSDVALGDWHVNRLSVDRRPLLILVSSQSLLPILLPARAVRDLPTRLPDLVGARLKRLGIEPTLIQAEARAMSPVVVRPTVDRSVVGIMVDFAKSIPFYLDRGSWDERTLPFVEARLAETPCHAGRPFDEVIFPNKEAAALLVARWAAG